MEFDEELPDFDLASRAESEMKSEKPEDTKVEEKTEVKEEKVEQAETVAAPTEEKKD